MMNYIIKKTRQHTFGMLLMLILMIFVFVNSCGWGKVTSDSLNLSNRAKQYTSYSMKTIWRFRLIHDLYSLKILNSIHHRGEWKIVVCYSINQPVQFGIWRSLRSQNHIPVFSFVDIENKLLLIVGKISKEGNNCNFQKYYPEISFASLEKCQI